MMRVLLLSVCALHHQCVCSFALAEIRVCFSSISFRIDVFFDPLWRGRDPGSWLDWCVGFLSADTISSVWISHCADWAFQRSLTAVTYLWSLNSTDALPIALETQIGALDSDQHLDLFDDSIDPVELCNLNTHSNRKRWITPHPIQHHASNNCCTSLSVAVPSLLFWRGFPINTKTLRSVVDHVSSCPQQYHEVAIYIYIFIIA